MSGPTDTAKLTYSQNGEDRMLETLLLHLFKRTHPINYIDIGGNDPISRSNTYLFYSNGGHGVVIEPNRKFYNRYVRYRPADRFLNAAISIDDEDSIMYYDFGASHGLNTIVSKRADSIGDTHPGVKLEQKYEVPALKINHIFEMYFKDTLVDLLDVDAEGVDEEIIRSLDLSRYRPSLICAEISRDKLRRNREDNINSYLASHNYALVASSFVNNIYADLTTVKTLDFLPFSMARNIISLKPAGSSQIYGPNDLERILTGGIGQCEKWGIWSSHEICDYVEILPDIFSGEGREGEIRLIMDMRAIRPMPASIECNGLKKDFILRPDFDQYEFILPGPGRVRITPAHPVSPRDLGQSSDSRRLGIAIRVIEIQFTKKNQE